MIFAILMDNDGIVSNTDKILVINKSHYQLPIGKIELNSCTEPLMKLQTYIRPTVPIITYIPPTLQSRLKFQSQNYSNNYYYSSIESIKKVAEEYKILRASGKQYLYKKNNINII